MRSLKPRLGIIALFITSNLLGLMAASKILSREAVTEMSTSGSLTLMLAIPVVGLIMLLLYKYNAKLLIKLWMLSALLFTTLIFYNTFFAFVFALPISLLILILFYTSSDWKLKNICLMTAFAGAGTLFGIMLNLTFASLFLIFLSIYDLIQVFYTKQMISLVKHGMSTDTFLGFQYPKSNTGESISDKELETSQDVKRETEKETKTPGILGGGDVIIPLLFAVTVFKSYGWIASLLSVSFAALGLFILFYKSQEGKFYPAIPAVASGSFLGLCLWLLLTLAF